MKVDFVTLDVFTDTVFGGNPLAVVTGADALSTEQMQAITREFNYSETTFVVEPTDPSCTAAVRIFSPAHELPFAGHPNVGTAVALARMGSVFDRSIGERVRFEERIGVVEIDILREGDDVVGARFVAPGQAERGSMFEEDAIAQCAGLPSGSLCLDNHLPRIVSLGVSFVFAELVSVEMLARCQPARAAFGAHLPAEQAEGLVLYARDRGDDGEIRLRVRVFAHMQDIVEDPATGSAAAMIGALLGEIEPGSDHLRIVIDQGIEMNRPSRIDVGVSRSGTDEPTVTVGGRAVPVMAGVLTVEHRSDRSSSISGEQM